MKDCTVVIRENEERTARECERLVRQQFDHVQVIRIRPFPDAVRQCFRIGIESGARWLVTVDADVLISRSCALNLWREAQQMQDEEWQLLGFMMDRLYMGERTGGVRLYRCSFLPRLESEVQDVVRPESNLCERFPAWRRGNIITGRHDYEQWYSDLHRKGAQHRIKHPSWRSGIVGKWRDSTEPELIAAVRGWDGVPLDMPEREPLKSPSRNGRDRP